MAAAARKKGVDIETFRILITIDINPRANAGGRADRNAKTVYVGNFLGWQGHLMQRDFFSIADTAYHHEVAHLWGWDHDWSAMCNVAAPFRPFATAPILLGWEDVDGDGIPEVNDPTPYGVARPR